VGYSITARITSIVNDSSGIMWFGTHHEGLVQFDGMEWKNYTTYNSDIPLNQIISLGMSPMGQVWYGARDGFAKMEKVATSEADIHKTSEMIICTDPFSETLRISIPDASDGPYQLYIYDFLGREIIRMNDLANQPITITTQKLPTGIYVIRVSGQFQKFTSKIIYL